MSSFLAGLGGLALWTVPTATVCVWLGVSSRRLDAEDLLAVGGATSLAVFLLTAETAARLGSLSRSGAWLWASVTAGSALLVGLVTLVVRRIRRRRASAGGTEGVAHPRTWVRLAIVSVLIVAACLPFIVALASATEVLPGSTPWYYWSLARQTVEADGFPETSQEWGTTVDFLDDYPAFTAATAALGQMSGTDDLAAAHLMRLIMLVGAVGGMYYLARSWNAGRVAALAAVFAFLALDVFGVKLTSYRPEPFGFGLMLATPALFRRYLVARQPALLAAAAAGLIALSQIHAIAFIVAAFLTIATAGSAMASRPRWLNTRRASVALLVVLLAWVGGSWALSGRVSDAGKLSTAPSIAADGTDPTWQFASFGTAREGRPPPESVSLVGDTLQRGLLGADSTILFASALVIGIGLAWSAAADRPGVREVVTATALFVLGLVAFATLLRIGWDTYVPRRTGTHRVAQLWVVLLPLLAAVAASTPRFRIRRLAVTAWLAIALAAWTVGIPRIDSITSRQRPADDLLALQRSFDLGEGSVVLSNAYTEGYIPVIFGAEGLLDGRAPYTENDLLERANTLLSEARDFFADPRASPFDFAEYGVDYLVVTKRKFRLGTPRIMPITFSPLRKVPGLELIWEGSGMRIYEVSATG